MLFLIAFSYFMACPAVKETTGEHIDHSILSVSATSAFDSKVVKKDHKHTINAPDHYRLSDHCSTSRSTQLMTANISHDDSSLSGIMQSITSVRLIL
jgi:hypothetical protein